MGLVEQHQAFKFAGGVETKMDSKAVPPVRLLALENGVFSKAISIKKRNGYAPRSKAIEGTTEVVTGARRLATRLDELLLFTTARCYSHQLEANQWSDAGALVAPTGYERPAVHTGTAQTMPDHATANGVTVYAWEDSLGGVWWTTKDAASGRVLRAPTQANANAQRPRCVPAGDGIHIYYAVPAQRQICVTVVNTTQPASAVTEQILVIDLDSTNPNYDACPTPRAGTPALIAWHEHATTNIRFGFVDASGVLGSPVSGHPSVARAAVTIAIASPIACAYLDDDVDGDEIGLLYQQGSSLRASCYFIDGTIELSGSTPVATGVGTIVRNGCAYAVDGSRRLWCVGEETAAQTSNHLCYVNWIIPTPPPPPEPIEGPPPPPYAGTQLVIRSLCLVSRAFQAGADADVFATFVHDTTYFNTYLTLRLEDFAPAGRHMPGSACGPTRTHVSSAYVVDDVAELVLPFKQRVASENNDKFTESAVHRIVMDFDSEDTHQTAQFGLGLYLAGACAQHYDGYKWTEQGFNMGPEYITHVLGAGGSLTTSSTYQYKVWYEWTDKQGEIHRGPESVGYSVATGANTSVTFTLPTLRVTRKDNVRICVARSLPGDTARLFRVSSLDPTTAGAVNGYITNSTTTDSVTFVDRMSDANLQLQEEIYTTGGILSNDPAPLGSHVVAGRNRLFYTDAQAGNIVRFSQRIAFGFGAEIAPELQHDINPEGGDITALAVMDDVVYVFKATRIFAFNGDGPFETGASTGSSQISGFSSGQEIPGDVGCTDPASIVLTPQGLMFKSAKGIYLLSRDRHVSYIGAPVEAYNTQSVRRATVMPDRPAVLFLTDSGLSLYYDHLFQQWSTFTNHEGYDAAVAGGAFYYLRTNDVVYKETLDAYADGTSRITLRFETAWLHLLDHLQGFQRFWKLLLLGTWSSPHQLAVQYRLNYDEAWSDPYYLDATGDTVATGWITGDSANTIGEDPILGSDYGDGNYGDGVYGGQGPDVYQWRYGIHENGQSVQFRFEDFEKAGLAGASFELTEMTIVGGVKKSDMRPFSGARST